MSKLPRATPEMPPLRLHPVTYNAIASTVDMVDSQVRGVVEGIPANNYITLSVYNTQDRIVSKGEAFGIGSPVLFDVSDDAMVGRSMMDTTVKLEPIVKRHAFGGWGVIADPIIPGGLGEMIVWGVAMLKVDYPTFQDDSAGFVTVAEGDHSASDWRPKVSYYGAAKILAKEASGGPNGDGLDIWAKVFMGNSEEHVWGTAKEIGDVDETFDILPKNSGGLVHADTAIPVKNADFNPQQIPIGADVNAIWSKQRQALIITGAECNTQPTP